MSEESTSPDLAELTRPSFELAVQRDFDAVMGIYASDAIWDGTDRGLGTFESAAAIRALFEDWFGAYDLFEIEMEEVLDFGSGVILVVNQQQARPTGSTGLVRTREAYLFVWVKNRIVRVTMYGDVEEGRTAAERLAEERG